MSIEPPVQRTHTRFPSLNALRAFESAARLGSFSQAAIELSVTPGAISQQIKTLENWANTTLFEREAQKIILTPTGETLLPMLKEAFDALTSAVNYLDNLNKQPTLHIAAMPCIAQLWLSPRLDILRRLLPNYTISVTAVAQSPDLQRSLYDASLFIEPISETKHQIILANDEIFPICTPALAKKIKKDGLDSVTRLHDVVWHQDWQQWSTMANHPLQEPHHGPQYSLYSIALEQCKSGQGVLIGHKSMVEPLLTSGVLVRPFKASFTTNLCLTLTLSKQLISHPISQLLIETLSKQAWHTR